MKPTGGNDGYNPGTPPKIRVLERNLADIAAAFFRLQTTLARFHNRRRFILLRFYPY